MRDISEVIEKMIELEGVDKVVITDESGSPYEFDGVEEDEEKAAVAAFIGAGIRNISETLDLDEFQSMTMSYNDGSMILYPVGDLFLGVFLQETKKLFKTESKINEILN